MFRLNRTAIGALLKHHGGTRRGLCEVIGSRTGTQARTLYCSMADRNRPRVQSRQIHAIAELFGVPPRDIVNAQDHERWDRHVEWLHLIEDTRRLSRPESAEAA